MYYFDMTLTISTKTDLLSDKDSDEVSYLVELEKRLVSLCDLIHISLSKTDGNIHNDDAFGDDYMIEYSLYKEVHNINSLCGLIKMIEGFCGFHCQMLNYDLEINETDDLI